MEWRGIPGGPVLLPLLEPDERGGLEAVEGVLVPQLPAVLPVALAAEALALILALEVVPVAAAAAEEELLALLLLRVVVPATEPALADGRALLRKWKKG